jgi:hypothetical protein
VTASNVSDVIPQDHRHYYLMEDVIAELISLHEQLEKCEKEKQEKNNGLKSNNSSKDSRN